MKVQLDSDRLVPLTLVSRNSNSRHAEDAILADLLQKTAAQDRLAFQALYDLVSGRLFSVIKGILRNNAEVEDALQESLLRIWRFAHRFDADRGKPMAWMSTISRNVALDIIKLKQIKVDVGILDSLEFATQPLNPPDRKLNQALMRLPPEQAKAIALMYTYGLSHSELAKLLQVPLGTAKSWVMRGTDQLRRFMKEAKSF